jgi:hypothetical protein
MRAAKIVYTKPLSRAKKPLKEAKEQFKKKSTKNFVTKTKFPTGRKPHSCKTKIHKA